MIQATNSYFYANNVNSLHNDIKPFQFYQCDITQLLSKNICLPYVPSSVAFNDFIILSNDCFRNWNPQSIANPQFLNNATVLRRISIAFFDHIKLLNTQLNDLRNQIESKNYQITDLQTKLNQRHTIYIVCIYLYYYVFLFLLFCFSFVFV